ncbi:MAG: OmpH family outer membrane protein, partial [Gemmobacter sp.]|nr:OmpH family outer membrane protein [Gemmobacter sp.]
MRRAGAAVLSAALALSGGAAGAQTPSPAAPQLSQGVPQLPFVTLDDARLFADSAWGKALLRRLEAEQTALGTENREIEARLAAQERDLTARRPNLPPAEFRALADAFNAEVERWRDTQKAKE